MDIYIEIFLWSTTTLAIIIGLELYMKRGSSSSSSRKGSKLPPGPKPWPIMGNMHVMGGKMPHRDLALLSTKHGPLIYLKLGSRPAIVACSAWWAMEVLRTHDKELGDRPAMAISRDLALGNVAFTETGPYWMQMRKIVLLELLSPKKIHAWRGLRMEEIKKTLMEIRKVAETSNRKKEETKETKAETMEKFVDIYLATVKTVEGLVGRLLFTLSMSEQTTRLKVLFQKSNAVLSGIVIGDYLPWLGFLDAQTHKRRAAIVGSIHALMHEMFELRQSQVLLEEEKDVECFLDLLLALRQQGELVDSRNEVLAGLLMGLFGASIGTSSTVVEWAMSELMRHPEKLRKVREEMEREVGGRPYGGGVLEEEEVGKLKYLEAVVKESLRLHPPVPMLIPRQAMEKCMVVGENGKEQYEVPKGALVYVNAWAIGRDPQLWEDPQEFLPERFMKNNDNAKEEEENEGLAWQQPNFMFAFGKGRRSCPGKALALSTIHIFLANLLFAFDWKTGDEYPNALDMNEKFGIVVLKKNNPLMLIPSPRFTM